MAGFGKNPVTSTQTALPGNQFPISTVAVPGHAAGDLTALEGGPATTDGNGNETAPASVYSKDGANITMGLIADAATVGDTSGTLSAKLRGLTKMLSDVWDSTNHRLHVVIDNVTALGQATMSTSSPVVIASDQSTIPVKRNAVAVYSLASTTTTGATQNSGDLVIGGYTEIGIDLNTTAQAGTSPTIQYFYERKGADGIYYILWQSAVLTLAANTLSTSIGAGMAYNQSLGITGRLRWVVGGSATPTYTHSLNIYGK